MLRASRRPTALLITVALVGVGLVGCGSEPAAAPSPPVTMTVEVMTTETLAPTTTTVRTTVTEQVPVTVVEQVVSTVTDQVMATVTEQVEIQAAAAPVSAPPVAKSTTPIQAAAAVAYYANCSEARAAGAAPLFRGDAGYRSAMDRDDDGVACE